MEGNTFPVSRMRMWTALGPTLPALSQLTHRHARASGLAKDTKVPPCPSPPPRLPCPRRQARGGPRRMARAQAAHCDSVGGSHRAWQACGWRPPGRVNRPFFGQPGPHPALGWPRPDSGSGSPACLLGDVLSLGHRDTGAPSHHQMRHDARGWRLWGGVSRASAGIHYKASIGKEERAICE